jgi:diguanylate cyclase (GGDEF)-like protein/PAS domain S-box-containing protein
MSVLRDRVAIIAATAILVIGIPVITSFAVTDFQAAVAGTAALMLGLLGTGIWLVRKGWSVQGRLLIVVSVAAALLGRAAVFGGVNSVPFVGWVVVIMLSAILIGGRTAWLTALLGIAAGGLLYNLEVGGQLPETLRSNTPLTALRIASALFLITALLTSTLSRRIEEALARVASSDEERITLLNRFRLAARGARFGIWDLDLESNQIWLGPGLLELLGRPRDPVTLAGKDFQALIHPEDRLGTGLYRTAHRNGQAEEDVSDFRIRHEDGHWIWVQSRGRVVPPIKGDPLRMVGSLTDIEETKALEQELSRRAHHDALTGLPNRQFFLDQLEEAIASNPAGGAASFVVLFIDLDRFKLVNDSLGHSAGDRLLTALSERLASRVPLGGTLARLGGDEFTVLLRGMSSLAPAREVAESIAEELGHPFFLDGREVFLRASIGVVLGDSRYSEPSDLLRDADLAMYSVKGQATVSVGVFDTSMRYDAGSLLELDRQLREAVDQRAFVPWYQPIVDLQTGDLLGVEALARWKQDGGGVLGPASFMHRAEETGWVLDVDRQVIEQAIEDFAGLDPLVLSVNLSARQLHELGRTDWLFEAMERWDFPASRLQAEVTETTLLTDLPEARRSLARLKGEGIRVALDDFGTGYSSLTYVHALGPQVLKIDITFVQELGPEGPGPICEAIVSVADKLRLGTSAEGIETEAQRQALLNLGCRHGQGYLFSKPLPLSELLEGTWTFAAGY